MKLNWSKIGHGLREFGKFAFAVAGAVIAPEADCALDESKKASVDEESETPTMTQHTSTPDARLDAIEAENQNMRSELNELRQENENLRRRVRNLEPDS